MKNQIALLFTAALLLTACAEKMPSKATSQSSPSVDSGAGVAIPGLGINNPGLTGGGGTSANPGNVPTGQLSGLDLQIKTAYSQYLPNCYNSARAQAWKDFFSRGGTMDNFIATLRIVATGTTCNSEGRENVTDPHFIRGYFDFYLPGCYTSEKHAIWNDFFSRGGTDNDFRITLANVATSSPRPSCLR